MNFNSATEAEETASRDQIINDLLSVSRSLADWARSEFESGATAHGVWKRLREAVETVSAERS